MCGRFTLTTPGELVARVFGLDETPALSPRYNVAPGQPVAVVRATEGERALVSLRWGLVPSWSRDRRKPLINARAESVGDRAAFREAFERRRCLVPADGFYEWRAAGGRRQPHHLRLKDGSVFAFAGLWEPPPPTEASGMGSFAILTTEPNELVREIHDRMPVILSAESYARWLDPSVHALPPLRELLCPFPAEAMTAWRVGPTVNNANNEEAACVAPV